jgi:antitoxin component YwqK of YwqJK toxin-antitoxin module
MKKIFLLISIFSNCLAFGQIDTFKTTYKNLPTLSCYRIRRYSTVRDGDTTYTLNNSLVDKETYNKFSKCDVFVCRPCLLELYDINDKLVTKGVTYGDCWSGPFVDYYSNGFVKQMGEYRQNSSQSWDNFKCSIRVGKWKYFDEQGNLIKTEYWKGGLLAKTILMKRN